MTGIEVIVAGLGRTGTMSMEKALDILGYKSYHMGAFLRDPEHPKLWREYVNGEASIKKVFDLVVRDGYNATMDSPMCDVYQDQMKLFPAAKVLLTLHPKGAEGWAKSFTTLMRMVKVQTAAFSLTYPNFFHFVPMIQDLNQIRNVIGTRTMGLKSGELVYQLWDKPAGWLEKMYTIHNKNVLEHVPSEKLLVFDVTQGWDPLCRFLDKPVPKVPFPHVNDSTSMVRTTLLLQLVIYAWVPVLLLTFLLAIWCCRRARKGNLSASKKEH